MRRLLRRRPATSTADTTPATTTLDPDVDPPLVAALVEPLQQLRASLGSGAAAPDPSVVRALTTASTQVADTEAPHRDGLHALESTWTSPGADNAVPALRTTQTQIGDISDRGPEYLSVLNDAHTTSSRAARKVDQIIADFRSDARQMLGSASASSDSDAVIARGTQALRDAVNVVTTARSEMDDHTARLDEMGPLTVSTPQGIDQPYSTQPYSTQPYSTQPSTVPSTTGTAPSVVAPGVATTQPLDPVQAAQLQLQQTLVNAGVQIGTTAIKAGVDIGTHLIDKIAEVGTHAMDTVAASADKAIDKAIPELLHPGSTAPATNGSDSSNNSSKLFDFGGGTNSSKPAPNTGTGSLIPPNSGGTANDGASANNGASSSKPAPVPAAPAPAADTDSLPRPANTDQPNHPGTTGGMAMPPPRPPDDQDHRPRDGQLGVTVPTTTATVPVGVIGEFDDDTL